jgi:hypothetical protein
MLWSADPVSTRMSMAALADATEARRFTATLKSERFFAEAGQSQADYDAGQAKPEPPRRRQPSAIHRRELTDVLRSSKRSGRKRGDSS